MLNSIAKKLTLGFAVILLVVISVSLYSYEGLKDLNELNRKTELCGEAQLSVAQVWQFLTDASAVGDKAPIAEAQEWAERYYAATRELRTLGISAVQLDAMDQAFKEFHAVGKDMAHTYIDEGREAGNIKMTHFDETGASVGGQAKTLLDQTRLAFADSARHATLTGGLGSTLAILLVLIVGAGALRAILPLGQLEGAASRIAGGDLSQEIAVQGSDEVGRLADTFKVMQEALRGTSVRSGAASRALGAALVEINASIQEQSSSLSSQAAAIAQATSSLEELKANALLNDERARDVLGATKGTIDGMGSVQEQVSQIATSIVDLSEKIQQIGEILDSVSDIADQSNLLALNASIEASKAGEFGRGFEVVAVEVRNLSQQSQRATTSIRTMLRDIQRAMSSAVMKTEEGTKRVATQVGELLTASRSVEQIVYATREQTQAIEQITDAVATVSGSLGETQSGNDQIADATNGLVDEAENLKTLLASFGA